MDFLLYFNKKYLSAILIDIDLVDHNIKDLCICGTHTNTSDIAHALDSFFYITLDDTFTWKKTLVLDTQLESHQCCIYRRGNLGSTGRFGTVTDNSAYITKSIDDGQRYLHLLHRLHLQHHSMQKDFLYNISGEWRSDC